MRHQACGIRHQALRGSSVPEVQIGALWLLNSILSLFPIIKNRVYMLVLRVWHVQCPREASKHCSRLHVETCFPLAASAQEDFADGCISVTGSFSARGAAHAKRPHPRAKLPNAGK